MSIHFFTSFSYSYLNRARVLAASIKRVHPDWTFWAIITDKVPLGFALNIDEEDYDHVLTAEELFGENTEGWLFGHDIVEACTAVKGRALRYILNVQGCQKVIYFDPDIAIFNSIDPVLDLLNSYSIVLTPHQIDPDLKENKRAIRDNEVTSLAYGVYNLGFIAVRNDKEGRRFAQWWDDRLTDWCHDRLDMGIFVDQKWCDLIPCFFDRVKVLRDPGYNVASWNLSQRELAFDENGNALVNGKPLRFFHFTKLGAIGDMMTTRYAAENIEIYELWAWYRSQVKKSTSSLIPDRWWYYGAFDNGINIPKPVRVLYREREDLQKEFPEPFRVANGLFEWLSGNGYL